uniref:Uncharacterized protein n=1 Tax=Wolbachia endosymbiont of Aleurodicus floccissimus TaxID=2152762 RepID=A0A3B0J0V1_9RICK
MRKKNTKTKIRVIRASKTAGKCVSSLQSDEEIHFIDLRNYMKMEEKKHYMK